MARGLPPKARSEPEGPSSEIDRGQEEVRARGRWAKQVNTEELPRRRTQTGCKTNEKQKRGRPSSRLLSTV